jgi:predicted RNA-binding Zn ribbon-like protein
MAVDPAPSIRLVRDFVNTAEPQLGTDQLVPAVAVETLERLGLVTGDDRIAAVDLALLIGVREGLRGLLIGHAGHQTQESVVSAMDDLLGGVQLTLRLDDGAATLCAIADRAAHRAVAAILSAVITAPHEEWMRLKVCARDSCRWAFFDSSRNRSGRWCSMAGCGNIVKSRRAYRTRTAGTTDPSA